MGMLYPYPDGGNRAGEGGKCTAEENFRHEQPREAGPPQARPAQLTRPYFPRRPPSERLLEGGVDQMNVKPERAHHLGRGRVFGGVGRKRPDPAAALDDLTAEQRGFTLGKTETQTLAHVLIASLQRVEKSTFEIGPEIVRARADRHRADDAGIGVRAIQRTANGRKRADARYQRAFPKADHQGAGRLSRRVAYMDPDCDRGKGRLDRIRYMSS